MVTDVGLNTDTLVEEHSERLRNAAIGHFLECKFITSSVIGAAIRETGYARTSAVRLNLLRSYSVALRAFESLASEELQLLREMFPPDGTVAPGLDGGARRFLSEREAQQFLLTLQEELERRGQEEAAELRQRMIQTKARPKSPGRRRTIGPARMPPPEPMVPPKRRPMGPPGRLLDPASGVVITGEVPRLGIRVKSPAAPPLPFSAAYPCSLVQQLQQRAQQRAEAAILRNRQQQSAVAEAASSSRAMMEREEASPASIAVSIAPSHLESGVSVASELEASDTETVIGAGPADAAMVMNSARGAIEAARRELGLPELPVAPNEGLSPGFLEELIP